MKKILLLLLLATFSIQAQTLQNPTYGNVKLKNNTTDNSATKVNVQSTDGTINTISKSDLVNVVEVNDVPSLPLVGVADKIYVVKNVNKIYRWNGTFYQELAGSDISGLQAQIDLKENTFSKNTAFNKNFGTTAGTVVEGGTLGSNAYSSTPYLPLTGGTINANNETINYKVSSNNGALYNSWYDFNNNRISFLGFGGGTQSNATFFVASGNGGNIALTTTGVGKVVVSSLSGASDGNIVADADGTIKRGTPLGSNAYTSTVIPTNTNQLTNGSGYITDISGKVDKVTGKSLIADSEITRLATVTNQDISGKENAFSKNTAFNKNFGTTVGTVVEGGTLGSNAYTSTVIPTNTNQLTNGSGYITDISGKVDKVTGKSLIADSEITRLATVTNQDISGKENAFTKNTAFNKNFGTTAGTIVEGGTLGSNAYSSTAYLPLSGGGTVNGVVSFNSTTGGAISFQTNSLPSALMTSSQNLIGGGASTTDFNTYVYGNNPYNIWTNGVKRVTVDGSGNVDFTGTVTASPATASNHLVTKAQLDASATSRPYKVYTALISQSGTSAPTATVLENTLGGSITWSRNSVGVYLGTLANGFSSTLSKVRIFISGGEPSQNTTGFYNALPNNIDSVQVNTRNTSGSLADSLMSTGATIEIRVYL